MMKQVISQKISRYISAVHFFLYLLLFVSLAFWLRAVSSIGIGLIFILVIVKHFLERRSLFADRLLLLFVIGCISFYTVQLLGCVHTLDDPLCQKHLRIKSALLFVPIAVAGSDLINEKNRKKLLSFFTIAVLASSLFCMAVAVVQYIQTKEPLSFFYYELVKPFSFHAIYFSILVFIVLVFLWEAFIKKQFLFRLSFHLIALIFLSVFIFLLSSRLVISWYILYLFVLLIVKWKKKFSIAILAISLVGAGYLILVADNPVSKRFNEIVQGDLSVIKKEQYDPGDYFGGLQFRLLYWRFVPEILSEQKSWIRGVSPGNSQRLLDKKYIEKNVYLGDPAKADRGFLGFNTHSQFLESLLQSGIIGVCIYLFICFILIKMMWQAKNRMMIFVTTLLLIYSLIESLFDTQYGILIFLFFPVFLYTRKEHKS